MTMTRRCRLLILLATLCAVLLVASAVTFEPQTKSKAAKSEHSRRVNRDTEREWWEEEEEEEGERRHRGREREEEEEEKEREREEEEEERSRHMQRNETEARRLVLERPRELLSTEAGSVKVLPRRVEDKLSPLRNVGLGFVSLEPKALLLPHYLDAPVVIYVQKGNARLGWVEEYRYCSTQLTDGDVYTLPGGTVHYILNTDETIRLNIFSAVDAGEGLNQGNFQPIFVAGGWDPVPVLSGFSLDVLAAAFQVARDAVNDILSVQNAGGIIYTVRPETNSTAPKTRAMLSTSSGSWWNGLQTLLEAPWSRQAKPFNILSQKPDFKNDNGWSTTVDKKAFPSLKYANLGMFAVSLKAGAMLAPHWNPRATEIGLVTKGYGYVHIAFPNGTKALDARVSEGSVFVVPRFYPVSQVASRDGTFEFVGFSTSSKNSKPHFLAGVNSVLNILNQDTDFDVLAAAFDVDKDTLHEFLSAQKDAVILSGYAVDVNATGQPTGDATPLRRGRGGKAWR